MTHPTTNDGPARQSQEPGPLFEPAPGSVQPQYVIPAGTPEGTCRGCGAKLYWIVTQAGKRMPVDPDGTSHFATCPKADSFRGKGKEPTLEMDERTAVKLLVAFVDAAPAWDETAHAARIVLATLKAQAEVGKRLEAIVHKYIKEAEEGAKP